MTATSKRRWAPRAAAGALLTATLALAGCGGDPPLMDTVQDCATTNPLGQTIRVDDGWCAGGHPGVFPVYSSIYSDGFYSPAWGAPLIGWNRQRPYNYNPTTVIVNSNRYGGTVNKVGTGSGVTSSTKSGSGSIPKYSSATSSKASSTASSPSVSRGGLGATSKSSTSSSGGSSGSAAS